MSRVTGFVPPIATPFRDGRLDLDSLKRLLDHIGDQVGGFLVGGSVGEYPNLTIDERVQVLTTVASHKDKRHTLAASISSNCLEDSRVLVDAAVQVQADVAIVSCPNYYTNDLTMLCAYFAKLGEICPLDLCLYDNPLASRTNLSISTIQALVAISPRLTHIKVTDPSPDKVTALRRETDLVVLAGEDFVLWQMLSRGAHGGMVALPMIYPEVASEIWSALSRGDSDSAYVAYRRATHFIHIALGAIDYVQVIKLALHHRGVIASPEVRLPLVSLGPTRRQEVLAAL